MDFGLLFCSTVLVQALSLGLRYEARFLPVSLYSVRSCTVKCSYNYTFAYAFCSVQFSGLGLNLLTFKYIFDALIRCLIRLLFRIRTNIMALQHCFED